MSARILVIEDNQANLELMVYLLQQQGGHEVFTATDGIEGLAAAEKEQPALILCDVRMPNMDGYEFVRCSKADLALKHIPVVAVTASVMADEQQKIEQAGFDGYFTKPIDPESFVHATEQFLSVSTGD
ncbi:response regulator [Alkalimonas collagenimarina]|uniref:Response regulator n=1 Tax=Alkalimonas collagenimarina TaxID=400390 RepID=A0ABT9GZ24_9GAMM|nr:response regulator [Alkalimonas collagenimarina]MDP4536310.1 response regulator [Alkalimonas collagenimarina]